jgi:ATP-dependent DNA helicase RecQ
MLDVLKKYFGYDVFRSLQREIIEHCVAGKDSLVLMPTGGGKSLCYQMPALLFSNMTLVVSPLIALMKDQVDALRANGVEAAYLNSSLSAQEMADVERWATEGRLKLLYLAPERIAMPRTQEWLKTLKVDLFAIDEAHCISEWGHDFRPEYRHLHLLRRLFPDIPLIALTATANLRVKEDIVKQLGLEHGRLFQSSFNRANLFYQVVPTTQAL